jgi:hypothetical protein
MNLERLNIGITLRAPSISGAETLMYWFYAKKLGIYKAALS